MRSSTTVLFLLLLACETTPRAPRTERPTSPTGVPPMPVPVIETSEVIEPPHPTLDDIDLLEGVPDEAGDTMVDGRREIHPHGGMTDCLEMYSACSPDPASPGTERCTSAPLLLACGQTGTIPGGDTLVCVCP